MISEELRVVVVWLQWSSGLCEEEPSVSTRPFSSPPAAACWARGTDDSGGPSGASVHLRGWGGLGFIGNAALSKSRWFQNPRAAPECEEKAHLSMVQLPGNIGFRVGRADSSWLWAPPSYLMVTLALRGEGLALFLNKTAQSTHLEIWDTFFILSTKLFQFIKWLSRWSFTCRVLHLEWAYLRS